MTSTELKHQARLQEWSAAVKDCRSSGISVRQWCRERGITTTTYYRWERELLAAANTTPALPTAVFAELPRPKQVEAYLTLPDAIFGSGEFYILRAKGDSMVDAGIEENDLIGQTIAMSFIVRAASIFGADFSV